MVSDNICGFEANPIRLSMHTGIFSSERWTICNDTLLCRRSSWGEDEHCIWHAEVDGKPENELREARARNQDVRRGMRGGQLYEPERLDGAHLKGINDLSLDLCGCVLVDANFEESTIRSDLSGAILGNANFHNARLDNMTLAEAGLVNTNFTEASLNWVDFTDARLSHANFSNAKLSWPELDGAKINGVDFTDAHIFHADFREVEGKFPERDDFGLDVGTSIAEPSHTGWYSTADRKDSVPTGPKLSDVKFGGVNLNSVNMSGLAIMSADFSGGKIEQCDFSQTQLLPSDFSDVDLSMVDFSGAHVGFATVVNSNLEYVDFSNSDIREADFTRSNFNQVEFTQTDARGAEFVQVDIEEEEFNRTDLRNTNFSLARLYGVVFKDVRISHGTQFGEKCVYEQESPSDYNQHRDSEDEDSIQVSRLEAAEWTYNRLRELCEKHALSDRAGNYHYRRQVARRKQARQLGNKVDWIINWTNFALTGYGERIRRTLSAATALILVSGVLYAFTGITEGTQVYRIRPGTAMFDTTSLEILFQGFLLSVATFTSGGFVNLQPAEGLSQTVASFESLAGTILVALFVFVLGQRAVR